MNPKLVLSAALAVWFGGGCLERRSDDRSSSDSQCTSCHGNPSIRGAELIDSAPPSDVSGNTSVEYPGVGAHSIHLLSSRTHPAFDCRECHSVPEDVHDPGHIDSDRPAEVIFGALASHGHTDARYDSARRRCSSTYCHGGDEPRWTEPRSSEQTCGTCHGLPPGAPHPNSSACPVCHQNVRADLSFVAPELHVDGVVQVVEPLCSACHGDPDRFAPPPDTLGNTRTTASGVGAHARHLNPDGAFRPIACQVCHQVPERSTDTGHLDTPLPAELAFSGIATQHSRTPGFDSDAGTCSETWCHTPGRARADSPSWTSQQGPLPCTGCHGMPPELPHPQLTDCSICHGEVIGSGEAILDPMRHIDGTIDVLDPERLSCTACHGAETPAPPPDLQGETRETQAGVGAHAIHLRGSDRARAVACPECHRVPETVGAAGHLDDDSPAEVVFSGPARAFGARPVYSEGVCSNTFCHGDSFVAGLDSGGTLTRPSWTRVDGTQAECGTCHGLPPPPPHPANRDCSGCHENVDSELRIIYPRSHVDGEVTFWVLPALRSTEPSP